jgi:arginyl-tRNA synthetase
VIVQKSDGTTTYFVRDLATIKYRLKKWNPDLIIYEVGIDQKLHFQQLFKTVEILGWSRKTKFVQNKNW